MKINAILFAIFLSSIAKSEGRKDKYGLNYPEDCKSYKVLRWINQGDLCYLKRNKKYEIRAMAWESGSVIATIPLGEIDNSVCREIFEPLNTFCKFA